MMQPNHELPEANANATTSAARIGRPRTWDWDAATTHLLTVAQTPDGLPTGKGAQAQIERIIADWFMKETNSTPAESLIRNHAAKIMRAIRPERP